MVGREVVETIVAGLLGWSTVEYVNDGGPDSAATGLYG